MYLLQPSVFVVYIFEDGIVEGARRNKMGFTVMKTLGNRLLYPSTKSFRRYKYTIMPIFILILELASTTRSLT